MKKAIFVILAYALCMHVNPVKGQVAATTFDISPLLIGETVPDGTLTDTKGNSQSFLSLIKDKPVIVIFYRGDWCPNCINHFNQEISPNLAAIKNLGYDLVAISPDSPE